MAITTGTYRLSLDAALNKLELAVNTNATGDVDCLSRDDSLRCSLVNCQSPPGCHTLAIRTVDGKRGVSLLRENNLLRHNGEVWVRGWSREAEQCICP